MDLNLMDFGAIIFTKFIPFVFALSFHEYAHGWVAKLRGDNTAQMMGRLTLNPVAHADLLGTVIFPLIGMSTGFPMFGWAKPVPVNERNLKDPVKDMFWVALAGPLSNIFLALVASAIFLVLNHSGVAIVRSQMFAEFAVFFVIMNLVLAFFNLIPLHPLDGGKVAARFLSYDMNRKLEENQNTFMLVLMVMMFSGMARFFFFPAVWLGSGLLHWAGFNV